MKSNRWRGTTTEHRPCVFICISQDEYAASYGQQPGGSLEEDLFSSSSDSPTLLKWLRRPVLEEEQRQHWWLTYEPYQRDLKSVLCDKQLSKSTREDLIQQACRAVQVLHEDHGRRHGGLSLGSFVQGMSGRLKLCTCPLLRPAAAGSSVSNTFVTPEALALPTGSHDHTEGGEQQQQLGMAADMFRLGCVLWYIVTGRHPFDRRDGDRNVANVLANIRQDVKFVQEEHLLPGPKCHRQADLIHLVRAMLSPAPGDRYVRSCLPSLRMTLPG